jgi:hypothetical protein
MQLTFANITLPWSLVISQWKHLFVTSFFMIIMYRWLEILKHLKDRGSEREDLPIGEKAPSFDYVSVNRGANAPVQFEPNGN